MPPVMSPPITQTPTLSGMLIKKRMLEKTGDKVILATVVTTKGNQGSSRAGPLHETEDHKIWLIAAEPVK